MLAFEVWELIKVPFPYTDRYASLAPSRLVIAAGPLLVDHSLL
jgi:mRNA interferase MazF